MENLKADLEKVITYIESKEDRISKRKRLTEYEVNSLIGGVPFKGKVDKAILYQGDGAESKPFYAVIDYKTYVKNFREDLLPYGLNMQLPIYSLLLANDERFADAKLGGVYFSPVLFSPKERAMTGLEDYGKTLRLNGLFLDDPDSIAAFGMDYGSDDYVAGTLKTKNGEYRFPGHEASVDRLEGIAAKTVENIQKADGLIKLKEFPVAPAKWSHKENACSNCSLRPFCFRKDGDFRLLGIFDDEMMDDEEMDGEE